MSNERIEAMNEQIFFFSSFVCWPMNAALLSFVFWINIKHTILDNKGELKVNARAYIREKERMYVGQF